MYLSDVDIKKAVKAGDIVLKPFVPARMNPASYDILLGNKFIWTDSSKTPLIDPVKKILPKTHEVVLKDNEQFILHPGFSILGVSYDFFGSDTYLIQLSGKSSLARIGLMVHNTAGLINPGHFLNITFELCNLNSVPIVLHPKMPIAQLLFSPLSSQTEKSYKTVGRYGQGESNFVGYKEAKKKLVVKKKK